MAPAKILPRALNYSALDRDVGKIEDRHELNTKKEHGMGHVSFQFGDLYFSAEKNTMNCNKYIVKRHFVKSFFSLLKAAV